MKTIQFRRYQLGAGTLDTFMHWWTTHLAPVRRAHGFVVEFAYAIPETDEIVWACSVEGDKARFLEVEAAYDASPERAEAFTHLPAGVMLSKESTFVDDVTAPVRGL